nr:reverse transcriptase domain-containing protein [Tanacetum cinerariifolium]
MPLSVWKKLMLPELIPTHMTLVLANWSVAYPAGIVEDVFIQGGKFTLPADFVVIDYKVDPCIPFILGKPFLRTARTLVDDHFNEVLKIQKTFHPFSGCTTSPSDSFPSLTSSETSDSFLKEFAVELDLFEPFPPGNENDNFDLEADLREIQYLLNRDPSTDSSPKTEIDIIDPIIESDSTLPEESSGSSEIATLLSSPFGNKDKCLKKAWIRRIELGQYDVLGYFSWSLSWKIQTSLWKNTSDSKKKRLEDMAEHLMGKLPPMLGGARHRMTWRQFILALGLHTDEEMAEAGFGAYWGQTLEKVTGVDLFYLRGMDRGSANGLLVVSSELPLIDFHELGRLNICLRVGNTRACVASRLELQQVAATGALGAAEDAPAVDEGAQAVPALVQPPQPPSPAPQHRTMTQRINRLEEEMRKLRQDVIHLRGVVESSITEQTRVST